MKVLKHPYPDTLYVSVHSVPADRAHLAWETMTEAELAAWAAAEKAGGWVPVPVPVPVTAPDMVTASQLLQWLIDNDKLDAVEAALDVPANFPNAKEQKKAKARWARSSTIRRKDSLVVAFGAILGMTPAEIDAAFIAAAQYP